MKTKLTLAALGLSVVTAAAQAPPGIPEPGLTLYGTVTNAANGNPVTLASVEWVAMSNAAPPVVISLGAASKPATRITTLAGASAYIVEVPFDTRSIGSGGGAVTLTDPDDPSVDPAERHASFAFPAAGALQYTLMPTINGNPANIVAINGAPAAGADYTAFGFSAAERGRAVRVDLSVTLNTDPYEDWADANFGNHTAADTLPGADPDGDGMDNSSEFQAGTDPNDAASLLRILTFSRPGPGADITVGWQSVAGKSYQIERSMTGEDGSWLPIGGSVMAGGTLTEQEGTPSASAAAFWRVRVVPGA